MDNYDDTNIFAKILRGTIPSYKIFETEYCIAILDAFPCAPGHALLISKGQYRTIMEMPAQVASHYLKELPRLCNLVKKATGAAGINIISNNEAEAGQEVFHVHVHVIPRKAQDKLFRAPKSARSMITAQEAKTMLAKMS